MAALGLLALIMAVYAATSESGRAAIRDIWHERHPSLDWPHDDPSTPEGARRARRLQHRPPTG